VPYPGSELFKMAKQNNWLRRPNLFFSEEWANKQSENPVMEINFKAEDLLRIRAELQNMFFLRNNLAIFLAFIVRPIYLFGIISCFLKNLKYVLIRIYKSLRERKISVALEILYQKFNEELMKHEFKYARGL
jgi:hypothetical protein